MLLRHYGFGRALRPVARRVAFSQRRHKSASVSAGARRQVSASKIVKAGVGAAGLAIAGACTCACMLDDFGQVSESGFPVEYNPREISAVWDQHPSAALHRLLIILQTTIPFMGYVQYRRVRNSLEPLPAEETKQLGIELRELLIALGPTFIKFGQMLSIRPDVLPPPVIYEL